MSENVTEAGVDRGDRDHQHLTIPEDSAVEPGRGEYPGDELQDEVFADQRYWRVGRDLKRAIFHGDNDFVGIMDTPALAALVVHALNTRLDEKW